MPACASGLSSKAQVSLAQAAATPYPADNLRVPSPGGVTYFVDPAQGDDANPGDRAGQAWKSFAKINALKLAPGDRVVVAPGLHAETLKPFGEGTAENPIVIAFLPGVHAFASEKLYRRAYFVSNSCDDPKRPLPIGLFVENTKHLRFQGGGAEGAGKTTILLTGPERSTYFINDHAEDISFNNLAFDLKRPTVSEYRVMENDAHSVVIHVAEGSTYEIKDGKFAWTGDLGSGWTMVQEATPENGRCWRIGRWDPFGDAKAEDLGKSPEGRPVVRLTYVGVPHGMAKGQAFQFRPVDRTVVTAHNTCSKDIAFRHCDFYAFTGMAIVSQFTDGITFDHVRAAPEKGTLRTCPAWADMFHFSGCRGRVMVNDCVFSGCQDDPINVHGTHLRILKKTADNQLLLRFMQPQTFGFAAFAPGDEVAVVGHGSLRESPGNPRRKVAAISPNPADPTGHEWLLTLDGPAPAFKADDVVDNFSWYPDVTVKNCTVDMDSCRGFLITTRGKAVVENNTFTRCAMSALLVEDDAEGWFESGPIRDLTVRGNTFIGCGIEINPHSANDDPAQPVHENIRIEGNIFLEGAGISAKGVKGLAVTGNRSAGGSIGIHLAPSCTEVKVENNAGKAKP